MTRACLAPNVFRIEEAPSLSEHKKLYDDVFDLIESHLNEDELQ